MKISMMNCLLSSLLVILLIIVVCISENGVSSETATALHFVPASHPSIKRFPESDSPYAYLDSFSGLDFNENRTKILVGALKYMIRVDLETFKLTNTSEERNIFSVEIESKFRRRCGWNELDCQNYFMFVGYYNSSTILSCGTYAQIGRCWIVYASNFTIKRRVFPEYGGDRLNFATDIPTGAIVGLITKNKAVTAIVKSKSKDSLQGFAPSGLEMSSRARDNIFGTSATLISAHEGDDGFVYFFFTETAEEVTERKTIYSRVGRVCTWDKGPTQDDFEKYVTYRKSQIICYKKGSVPDYYDHIQSTSMVRVHNNDGTSELYIYASFTTTVRSTGSSAICRYRLKDISKLFETSRYYAKDYNNGKYIITDFPKHRIDWGRKKCDSKLNTLIQKTCDWGCSNPMLYNDNEPFDKTTVMIFRGERITALAVDDIHRDTSKNFTDVGKHVLFAGTDSGMIYKVVMNSTNVGEPVFLEKIQAVKKPGRITRLYFNKDYMIGLGSTIKLLKIKKERCESSYLLCSDCLKSRDPYCAWSIRQKKCTRAQDLPLSDRLQSVETGNDSKCPPVDIHISCSLQIVDNVPGARTALLCAGHGLLPPKVLAWKKGAALLELNQIYQVKVVNQSAQMLIIRDYTTADLGTYGCVVGAGRNKSLCEVTIKATTTEPPTKKPITSKKSTKVAPTTATTQKSKETTKPTTTKKTPATPGKRVTCPGDNEEKYFAAFVTCLVLLILTLLALIATLFVLRSYRNQNEYYNEEDEFDGSRKGTLNVSKNHDSGPHVAVELFQRKRHKVQKTDSSKPLVKNKKKEPKNGCNENSSSKHKRESYKTAKEMDDLGLAEDGRTIHT